MAITFGPGSRSRLAVFGKIGALWLVFLVSLSSCSMVTDFRDGQASFDQGVALFNQGHFKEAVPYFERATAENPRLAEAYLYLGRSHLSMRRWREAIQPLRTAHRLSPEDTKHEALNLLIDALFAVAAGASEPGRPADYFKDTL